MHVSGWMIYGQDLPREASCIADIPDGFRPQPIGSRAKILSAIREVAPYSRFDPEAGCGTISFPGCSIEFPIGQEDPCVCISFEVRAITQQGITLIADILDRLKLRALQTGESGDFFDRATAMAAYLSWRNYHRQIISPSGRLQ